jgi:hypothetical protein
VRAIATVAAVSLVLCGAVEGGSALAASGATWKVNATPNWSRSLTGFQVSFFRHRRKLGLETPNWITLRCSAADGSPGRTVVGGFGAHFESRGHPLPARFGLGKANAIKGVYDTAKGTGGRAVSVLDMPPDVPAPSVVQSSLKLTPRRKSVSGTLSFSVSWTATTGSPYRQCGGTFKVRPR